MTVQQLDTKGVSKFYERRISFRTIIEKIPVKIFYKLL